MNVVVNGGKGTSNTLLNIDLHSLRNTTKNIKNLPKEFIDIEATFDDGYMGDTYIYKLCLGNMEFCGMGERTTITYSNADTSGEVSSITFFRNNIKDTLDIAIGIGIFGKAFESLGKSITLKCVENDFKEMWGLTQHLHFIDSDGCKYMLSKRFYQFWYELDSHSHSKKYNGKSIASLLKDNGKAIKSMIKKVKKECEKLPA